MHLLKKLEQRLRKIIKSIQGKQELPRFYRAQERFRRRYPKYSIGVGTYGMPKVHDWDEGTTLRIGSYCSIADNVQIFLGGQHRIDWVSSYPFPAYLPEAQTLKTLAGVKATS